ncbi:MAG TPA: histidine kinase [Prolixibacteraceae bacterium]|nr:histidine kinase [Prolixibacteraceae bacterium]
MRKTWLICLFVCLTGPLFSQQRPIINYTTHNGLPQIQVRVLHQDIQGFLWIGTKSGLAKFNGENFEHFLLNEEILTLNSDFCGNVFITTANAFYKFDGRQMKQIIPADGSLQIAVGQSDFCLWNSDNIFYYQNDSIVKTFQSEKDLPEEGIRSLAFEIKTGKPFFNSKTGKDIYSIGSNLEVKYESGTSTPNEVWILNSPGLGAIRYMKDHDTILISSVVQNKKLFRYIIHNDQVQHVDVYHLPCKTHLLNHMYSVFELDSASLSAREVKLPEIKAPYPVIHDRDGNLWAGSDNGLYQISAGPLAVFPRLFLNDFWTLIKGNDGFFYGGAYKQGLFRLDFEKQQRTELITLDQHGTKEINYYYGSSKDKSGNLYFPTHYGLVKYDYHHTKKFDTGISLISKFDSLTNRIVIGQEHGIAFVDTRGNIENFTNTAGEIVKSHPVSMAFDRQQNIWIGSGKSLAFFDRKTSQLKSLQEKYPNYPTGGIVAMTRDQQDNIWMGGRSGLWLLQEKTNRVLKVADEKIGNMITALLTPNDSLLLIGTTREVYILNTQKFFASGETEMKLLNFRNGFIGEEVAQNGFLQEGDLVYIPSTTYISVLDLRKIKFESEFSAVVISRINGAGILMDDIFQDKIISIERGLDEAHFEFETVGFGLPTTTRYSYKLENFDNDWSPWDNQKNAYYSNLPSGKYRFRVKALPGGTLSDGPVRESSIGFSVSLPFYKEPFFYRYAMILWLFLSLIVGYYARSRYLYRIKVLDRERKIKYLEVATLQAQLNPHFIFNILSSVQNLIGQHEKEKANAYLIKFSRLIRAYMESSIKSIKILSEQKTSNEISLKEEIDLLRMYIELEQVKYEQGKINFDISLISENLLNKTFPPMIIQPFVENAIKHGLIPKEGSGKLSILFSGNMEDLVCTISDDGIGRKRSSEIQKNSIKAYHSRGIELIYSRIEILNQIGYNIAIHFEDPPEGGTIVSISFNL